MNFITFGIETGIINLVGDWSKLYNNTKYISPYILINTSFLLPNTGVSINVDYFATNNDDKDDNISYSTYELWGTTVDFHYFLAFSSLFNISFSAGLGAMFSEIKVYTSSSMGPFSYPTGTNKSVDAYLDLSLSFNIQFKPVQLKFGSSYKGIFQKSVMHTWTIFVGMGYSI